MWFKRLFKFSFFTLLIGLFLMAMFLASVYVGVFGPLPDKEDLLGISNEQASLVLSNDGTLIGKFFAENRTNIKWEEVPPQLVKALIATEDKRFFEHQGIDGRSYLRVFFKTILLGDKSSGGGSTITQQLVKNLYGRNDHSFLSMPVNKVREAMIASRLEDVLSKEGIILLYLNSVPFGEEVYGVEAAAKRYFDKNAKQLNIQESAILVGMLKANTRYNPRLHAENAVNRRNQVIDLMATEKFISKKEADSLKNLKLELKYTNYQLQSQSAYFVHQVKRRANLILEDISNSEGVAYDIKKDGLRIHTTIDIKLQRIVNASAQKQLKKMQVLLDKELKRFGVRKKWEKELRKKNKKDLSKKQKREILTTHGMQTQTISKADSLWHYYKMLNSAVLAVDPKSGAVYAWRGGNNFRFLPYDLVFAKRQMASTIKPFIYAAALEEGFEICDYFSNNIQEYENYEGWKPENYDKSFTENRQVAMWYALTRSMNLPTVDLYFKTGHENVADLCRRLDLDAPYDETPAMSLGALDASLYDIVKAYAAFANDGYLLDDLLLIEKITDDAGKIIYQSKAIDKDEALAPEIAEQITTILRVAINEGTGVKIRNRYNIKADLAGKTGTAQNYSDAWFVSFTPNIVIGSWVGASSPEMHFRGGLGSGSVLALPISGDIISEIEKRASLRNKYLNNFEYSNYLEDINDCDPFREEGVSGFFNRLKNHDPAKPELIKKKDSEKPKKERSKLGKFFDNIFKKKKK
jgi:penicillin-binding protein 1A